MRDELAGLTLALFLLAASVATSWWALWWGWGLTIQSWAGVIMPACGSLILLILSMALRSKD